MRVRRTIRLDRPADFDGGARAPLDPVRRLLQRLRAVVALLIVAVVEILGAEAAARCGPAAGDSAAVEDRRGARGAPRRKVVVVLAAATGDVCVVGAQLRRADRRAVVLPALRISGLARQEAGRIGKASPAHHVHLADARVVVRSCSPPARPVLRVRGHLVARFLVAPAARVHV